MAVMGKSLFLTNSPSATRGLGKKVASKLPPGSVVALIGELGSGKTCFTKGLCAGLGIPMRRVNSPTFAFVNEYRGRLPVLHVDLYRIESLEAVLDLGMMDYLEQVKSGIMVIEWADKILDLLSDGWLEVDFVVLSPRRRKIRLTGFGEMLGELVEELE